MKIIAIERESGVWPEAMQRALASSEAVAPEALPVSIIADTAVARPGFPMFVPDFARSWRIGFMPAVGLGRLGKWIEPRFAPRYYSTLSLVARLLPPEGYIPAGSALMSNIDGSLATAPYIPLPEEGTDLTFRLEHTGQECTISTAELRLPDTVALVSRYMTLRTGDILLPCLLPFTIPVELDSKVDITLNGEPILSFKVK